MADGDVDSRLSGLRTAFSGAAPLWTPPAFPADDPVLLADLQTAAGRGELSLVYQRQSSADGRPTQHAEALLRWRCPQRGLVSPALFIPLAERADSIRPITDWVLGRLLADTAHVPAMTMGFNASALEFSDPIFVEELGRLIAESGSDARRLEIEITETAILADAPEVEDNLKRLRALGLRIALDDFGAGQSSIAPLERFAFDTVKIDRGLVHAAEEDARAAILIGSLADYCRGSGARTVAEGIETPEQLALMADLGIDDVQGYWCGAPGPVEELI
jgi:EAL domain-containing protein (putative c-di-GMP-specific phosphodiesterase class I)